MGAYIAEKRDEKIQKMIVLGAKLVITYSNLFTYYEQDMVKSVFIIIIITMSIKDDMKIGRICL
jgi:hypothetical protein